MIKSRNGLFYPVLEHGASVRYLVTILSILLLLSSGRADTLQQSFENPPQTAKPWTYWFWMNGNITREGITADLEAMARVGIGGVLIMEVANPKSMAPTGPVPFGSPQWRELFKHVVAECSRLGMQVNMNNDAGWCGSGGPWIPPSLSMQMLVATNVMVQGPGKIERSLPRGRVEQLYYKDVKTLAFPEKPKGIALTAKEVLDISDKVDADGRLVWDAPPGGWRILRVGVTTTGAVNKPAPVSGLGLECDKFNPEAIEHHFKNFIGKLADDNEQYLKKVFTSTHIDSWEVGDQDWTPRMAEEFRARRGYDLVPWLTVLCGGQVLESSQRVERFHWDFTRTKAELNVEAYAEALKRLANQRGLKLSIEAYNGKGFLNPLTYGAVADVPMAEFWIVRWGGWHLLSSRLMASAGHVDGRPVIGAESFTSWAEADPWTEHPYSVKAIGDWAFCEGINHFVFHRTVMDPWTNRMPGMTFAGFGWHVDRNQTWWEPGTEYMKYLARCQALLQSGQFVADVCRLVPSGENFGDPPNMRGLPDQYDRIPVGYNYDYVSDKALIEEMSVESGHLVTKSGMRYRALQLPNDRKMTPQLLGKIRDFVKAGALVSGPRPEESTSLQNYPKCDQEVQRLAKEIWGECDGSKVRENVLGNGRAFWGAPLADVLSSQGVHEDFAFAIDPPMSDEAIMSVTQGRGFPRPKEPDVLMPTAGMNWIHRRIGEAEVYFVANPQHREVNALCTFRVKGMTPEIWDPQTGRVRPAVVFREVGQGTEVPLTLDTAGSCFVVFREKANPAKQIIEVSSDKGILFGQSQRKPQGLPEFSTQDGKLVVSGPARRYELLFADGSRKDVKLTGAKKSEFLSSPWTVHFQPGRGAPEKATFESLIDWAKYSEEGIRHFSGVATYSSTFNWKGAEKNERWSLDLGEVRIMAEVTVNGTKLATLWKPPFAVDVTQALKPGENRLEVRVWNQWPNRLIGDEQFPDDCTPDGRWKSGRLPAWPEWLLKGEARPEPGRLTFTTWKYYTKNSPLKPSGLIGPVHLVSEPYETVR